MHYVISDVHGRYDLFLRMLERIGFGAGDTLYLLGDCIDRGPDGIAMLLDVMGRENVVPFLGNHEDMFLRVIRNQAQRRPSFFRAAARQSFFNWTRQNGGLVTWQSYLQLESAQQAAIRSWLEGLKLYEELCVGGNRFLLVHAGVGRYEENKPLAHCSLHDFIWERMDYDRQYYDDKLLVTGHTPTGLIDTACLGRFYRRNNHIAIDCGAVFTGTLGCLCLDTLEEIYVR